MIIYEGVIVEERGTEIAERKREESGRTLAVELGISSKKWSSLKGYNGKSPKLHVVKMDTGNYDIRTPEIFPLHYDIDLQVATLPATYFLLLSDEAHYWNSNGGCGHLTLSWILSSPQLPILIFYFATAHLLCAVSLHDDHGSPQFSVCCSP